MTIGERIKLLRTEKGLTQKQLASITGLSEISIRKYESDDRRPKINTIRTIAVALDSYIGYFLDGYFTEYANELAEDFASSGKKEPQSMQIIVPDELGEQLEEAKKILSLNPKDPIARAHAKQTLNDVAIALGYKNERDFTINQIKMNINDLNEKGLSKVLGLTQDLLLIKDYLLEKDTQKDKSHLEPVAARERTDIEVTDEMRKHDDDIMDDPDF